MNPDLFGALHADGDKQALLAYESAAGEFLRHRSPALHLMHALSLEPQHGGALALQGFCNVLLARRDTLAQARINLISLSAAAKSDRDIALCKALAQCCNGNMDIGIAVLREWLAVCPSDIIVVKFVHALQFMSGSGGMAAFTSGLLQRIDCALPGYGYLLGCHAFALEERGDFAQAESVAQAALHRDSKDLWAMHALTHVYEMGGRDREGIIWIESARDLWSDAGNFAFHLAWHLALFNLNLGKTDRALAVYDRDVRAAGSVDFRDMANAISLLWRLRQHGVDVGARFEELADVARARSNDTTLVFACLHVLLALLAVGDDDAAGAIVSALRAKAGGLCDQSEVAARVGLPLAEALVAFAQAGQYSAVASSLPRELQSLGGSQAQRDVFLRSLALMAARSDDRQLLDIVLGLRHEFRRADRFLSMVETLARERRADLAALGRAA